MMNVLKIAKKDCIVNDEDHSICFTMTTKKTTLSSTIYVVLHSSLHLLVCPLRRSGSQSLRYNQNNHQQLRSFSITVAKMGSRLRYRHFLEPNTVSSASRALLLASLSHHHSLVSPVTTFHSEGILRRPKAKCRFFATVLRSFRGLRRRIRADSKSTRPQ